MVLQEYRENKTIRYWLKSLFVLVQIAVYTVLVYLSGGTSNALPHLMYLAILSSAYFFGYRETFVTSFIAGLALGPIMPINVNLHIMQTPRTWLVRMFFFVLVGGVSGYLVGRLNHLNYQMRESDLRSIYTKLYNTNKLNQDLDDLIDDKCSFSIVLYRILNLDMISKYVDDKTVNVMVEELGRNMRKSFQNHICYSHGRSEFLVVFEDASDDYIREAMQEFYASFANPMNINGYRIQLLVKVGVAKYPEHGSSVFDILSRVRSASDQGEPHVPGIFYYNEAIDQANRMTFDVTNALTHAIQNNDFYLVYQPKIDLRTESISGVEALIRWNRKGEAPIGPNVFIKVAEDIGVIQEISLWVATECAKQILRWKRQGIDVNVGINLTSRELLDPTFRELFHAIFVKAGIHPESIEIEITERVVIDSNSHLREVLQQYGQLGYRVAIDDYGTGYNTHFSMGEVDVDTVKLDKYFVDRLDRREIRVLVQSIIDYVHQLDKEVVAEGVETREQVELLEAMSCDIIQGYYYSKPLKPEDVLKYYHEWVEDEKQQFVYE
mgnify:CR=1 FL=1